MKIGMFLKSLFEGETIKVGNDDVTLQFHFGDQKELNAWIANKLLTKKQKYPLLWYVVAPPTPTDNESLNVSTKLIIFQGTKSELFNTDRYFKTYEKYIEPVYELVQKKLYASRLIRFENNYGLPYFDEPNYGVEASSSDFSNLTDKKQKSVTIDIVDAKVITLDMFVKLKCNNG